MDQFFDLWLGMLNVIFLQVLPELMLLGLALSPLSLIFSAIYFLPPYLALRKELGKDELNKHKLAFGLGSAIATDFEKWTVYIAVRQENIFKPIVLPLHAPLIDFTDRYWLAQTDKRGRPSGQGHRVTILTRLYGLKEINLDFPLAFMAKLCRDLMAEFSQYYQAHEFEQLAKLENADAGAEKQPEKTASDIAEASTKNSRTKKQFISVTQIREYAVNILGCKPEDMKLPSVKKRARLKKVNRALYKKFYMNPDFYMNSEQAPADDKLIAEALAPIYAKSNSEYNGTNQDGYTIGTLKSNLSKDIKYLKKILNGKLSVKN